MISYIGSLPSGTEQGLVITEIDPHSVFAFPVHQASDNIICGLTESLTYRMVSHRRLFIHSLVKELIYSKGGKDILKKIYVVSCTAWLGSGCAWDGLKQSRDLPSMNTLPE